MNGGMNIGGGFGMGDISKYDFHINKIKEQAEKTKELNRKVVKQEEILADAIQDRIIGEINTEELGQIIKESDDLNNKCSSARMELYRMSKILSEIEDELKHIISNSGYSTAEMDCEINVARLFFRC
jgi:predicted nuclease with TOPRIM domain